MSESEQVDLIAILVAKTFEDGGLTYNFKSSKFVEPMDYWYFPKYPKITAIVDKEKLEDSLKEFIKSHHNLLIENDTVFGTWVNPKSNKVYIDINTYKKDKAEALKTAKIYSKDQGRNIVSMYNPVHDKTIYIDH